MGGGVALVVAEVKNHGPKCCLLEPKTGSKESNIQLPDFVHRHRVGPLSSVPQEHRPTHCTSLVGCASDLEACIATSFKLTLPSVFAEKKLPRLLQYR
jgi:hypothetical protein